MKKQKIKVGVDFDGVLAYNPFRIVRAPVTFVKRSLFGMKKTHFHVPASDIEKLIWTIMHESSVFPAKGAGLLKELVENDAIEAHLVTARYSFLKDHLFRWLTRFNLTPIFTSITLNERDEQPHLYKEKAVKNLKLDHFIEDNWDIVAHLQTQNRTKVHWIYNIFDRGREYPHKYPYLEKALKGIIKEYH